MSKNRLKLILELGISNINIQFNYYTIKTTMKPVEVATYEERTVWRARQDE